MKFERRIERFELKILKAVFPELEDFNVEFCIIKVDRFKKSISFKERF